MFDIFQPGGRPMAVCARSRAALLRLALASRTVLVWMAVLPAVLPGALHVANSHFHDRGMDIRPRFIGDIYAGDVSYVWLAGLLESRWAGRLVPWAPIATKRAFVVMIAAFWLVPAVARDVARARASPAEGRRPCRAGGLGGIPRLVAPGLAVACAGAWILRRSFHWDAVSAIGMWLIVGVILACYVVCVLICLGLRGTSLALLPCYVAIAALVVASSQVARAYPPSPGWYAEGFSAGGSSAEMVGLAKMYATVLCAGVGGICIWALSSGRSCREHGPPHEVGS